MKKCDSSYNPDDLNYESPQERRERIKDLEKNLNATVDYTGELLTQNYPYQKFDGSFEEETFWEWFYPEETDHQKRVRSQIKAVRYALWFARKNNNRAKNLIITVINQKDLAESEEVIAEAKNAFYLFITSFIRTEIEKKYREKQVMFENKTQYSEAIREAMNYTWEFIMMILPKYNPDKGAITTFLRGPIKEGFFVAESKRNKKSSKQLLSIDGQIVKAKQKIEEKGIEATPRLIELQLEEMRKPNQKVIGVQQIIASDERTKGEASCFSADGDTNEAVYFNREATQTRFLTPEEAVETAEKNKKILDTIASLDDLSRYILLASQGFEITENGVFEVKQKSVTMIAKELDLSENEVFKKKNIAIDHFKKAFLNEKEDTLLKGKELEFEDEFEDDDLCDFLDSIITITDDDFV